MIKPYCQFPKGTLQIPTGMVIGEKSINDKLTLNLYLVEIVLVDFVAPALFQSAIDKEWIKFFAIQYLRVKK